MIRRGRIMPGATLAGSGGPRVTGSDLLLVPL